MQLKCLFLSPVLSPVLDGVDVLFFTDMREASKRLAESLFDSYENDWVGEEDLGAIVEVSVVLKLLWLHYKRHGFNNLPGDTNLNPPPVSMRN